MNKFKKKSVSHSLFLSLPTQKKKKKYNANLEGFNMFECSAFVFKIYIRKSIN